MAPTQIQRQECIVYSRVVGWLTPVKNYNRGKAAEYKDRKTFKVDEKQFC
jgi:ribonucleoside-triphosphate reductase